MLKENFVNFVLFLFVVLMLVSEHVRVSNIKAIKKLPLKIKETKISMINDYLEAFESLDFCLKKNKSYCDYEKFILIDKMKKMDNALIKER
jgi:hypothetical protein